MIAISSTHSVPDEVPVLSAPASRGPVLRVLLVAGDPLARAGLAALMEVLPHLEIVGKASDADDAPAALAAFLPDVVLLGLGWDVERLDGLAAYCAQQAPVVALLGAEATSDVLARVWEAGPRAVLGRGASAEQVGAAVAAVAEGLALFDPAHALWPPALAAPQRPQHLSDAGPMEALTPRELEVLQQMADGLSNKMIARALGISEHTVKYHVNAILGKLNAQSRTEAVVRATRAGLLLL